MRAIPTDHSGYAAKRYALQQQVLELIFAANGDTRKGIALAEAAGLSVSSFDEQEHRILWLAAQIGSSNHQALWLAREGLRMFRCWVLDMDGWFERFAAAELWDPARLRKIAEELRFMEANHP